MKRSLLLLSAVLFCLSVRFAFWLAGADGFVKGGIKIFIFRIFCQLIYLSVRISA